MNRHRSQSIKTHDTEDFCTPLAVMSTQGNGGRWRHGVSKLPTPIFNRKQLTMSHCQPLNLKRDSVALRNQQDVTQNASQSTNHNASHPIQPTANRNSALSTNQFIKNGMHDKEDERSDCGALGNSRQNVDNNSTAAESQLNLSPPMIKTPTIVSGKCDEHSNFDSGCSVDQVDDADDSCSCSTQDCCLEDACTTDDCWSPTTDGCHSCTDRNLMPSDRELDWDSVSEERDSERNFRERLELELQRLHRESLRKRNARESGEKVDLENKVGTGRKEAKEDGNGGVGNWKNTESGLSGKESLVGCKKMRSCDNVMATVIGQLSRLREQDQTSDGWNRGDPQSNKGDLQGSKGDPQRSLCDAQRSRCDAQMSRCDAQMSRCDAQRSQCDVDNRICRSDAWRQEQDSTHEEHHLGARISRQEGIVVCAVQKRPAGASQQIKNLREPRQESPSRMLLQRQNQRLQTDEDQDEEEGEEEEKEEEEEEVKEEGTELQQLQRVEQPRHMSAQTQWRKVQWPSLQQHLDFAMGDTNPCASVAGVKLGDNNPYVNFAGVKLGDNNPCASVAGVNHPKECEKFRQGVPSTRVADTSDDVMTSSCRRDSFVSKSVSSDGRQVVELAVLTAEMYRLSRQMEARDMARSRDRDESPGVNELRDFINASNNASGSNQLPEEEVESLAANRMPTSAVNLGECSKPNRYFSEVIRKTRRLFETYDINTTVLSKYFLALFALLFVPYLLSFDCCSDA